MFDRMRHRRYQWTAVVLWCTLAVIMVSLIGGIRLADARDDLAHYVFVPNRASADIAVIDSRTDTVVARLPVGQVPHQVVISDTLRKLVASNTADNTIKDHRLTYL